jgi:CBS domain-containing protein
LSQAHVSGAPVVDSTGKCIGVLSATDFVHWAEGTDGARPRGCSQAGYTAAWQLHSTETLPVEAVSHYMTQDPVTVAPTRSIGDLARIMVDAHIHRVIVIDAAHQPVGIVTSTDVLAALARAGERRQATATDPHTTAATALCKGGLP